MAEPFVGEIRTFAFGVVPDGWHLCDGTLLKTKEHPTLFSMIGKVYGGDGISNFALPDLRGRVPRGMSVDLPAGTYAGAETVTLTIGNLPTHNHSVRASNKQGQSASPGNNFPAAAPAVNKVYAESGTMVALNIDSVTTEGNAAPINNMQPFLVTNYCIAMRGLWPLRG